MKSYKTRINMLSLVNKRGKICELGTLRGDFSEIIMSLCDPAELVLVDLWDDEIISGDVNGNNLEKYTGQQLFEYVTERFRWAENISIRRELTAKALKKFPNNYFDMIYIDADHSYEAVVKDLNMSFKKIKDGGFIMGHDYEMNPAKTENVYDFGVNRAVDEFCYKEKQQIYAKAYDGCVSYAIRAAK
jgi:predicted O-methyltransferase YrrM